MNWTLVEVIEETIARPSSLLCICAVLREEKERFCRNPPISAVHSFILANFATKEVNSRTPNSEDLWGSLKISEHLASSACHPRASQGKPGELCSARQLSWYFGRAISSSQINFNINNEAGANASGCLSPAKTKCFAMQAIIKCNDRSQTQRLVQLL